MVRLLHLRQPRDVISPLFYRSGNNTLALIAYLSTFAVGFVVRPFGALFFGRIGDLVGRKYAFLVTLLIMGGATALIGFLPTYASIGIVAPIILLVIRILQGLALGGEYGGAAVYVAEHVPDDKARFLHQLHSDHGNTRSVLIACCRSWSCRTRMSKEAFSSWGWRIPFLHLDFPGGHLPLHPAANEGIADLSADQERRNDLSEAAERGIHEMGQPEACSDLALWRNGGTRSGLVHRPVLCVVLSADDSQGERTSANYIVAIALVLGMPLFVVFGALSDRIGRKWIMMLGCLLAAVSYMPIYTAMQAAAGSECRDSDFTAKPGDRRHQPDASGARERSLATCA